MSRTQIEIFVSLIVVSIAVVVIILVGFNENDRMDEKAQSQHAEAVEVGADLFETNCSGCHGIKGEGIPGLAPGLNDPQFFTNRLDEVGWEGTLEDYIMSTVSTGRTVSTRPDLYVGGGKPAMPAWSQQFGGPLREDQVRNLATYILNWEATAVGGVELAELPTPTRSAEIDPLARGEQIFASSGCGGCHTIEGVSFGEVGPNLTQIGDVAATRKADLSAEEYIRESILQTNAFVVDGYQENIMPQNYDQQLNQSDLDDLVTFLLAQQ